MGNYKLIFTWEKDNDLGHYVDCPEEGTYEGEAEFSTLTEFDEIIKEWEGHLYQLFKDGRKIGSGVFDPDSPIEEIVLDGVVCCGNCDNCFWKFAYDNWSKDFWSKYKPANCPRREWRNWMRKEMKLMEFAAMIDKMKVGEVIDFAAGSIEDVEMCGGWCGVKRIDEFDQDNPMYLVSHYGGEGNAFLYHISEYDHRIGDFCERELSKNIDYYPQIWINCCARMIADYMETFDGIVSPVITVEWE